jgi:hypothetical protein
MLPDKMAGLGLLPYPFFYIHGAERNMAAKAAPPRQDYTKEITHHG